MQDTLLIAEWRDTEPILSNAWCAQWAAELAVGRPLSKLETRFKLEDISFVKRNDAGRYNIRRPLGDGQTDEKEEFSFSRKELIALGEQSGSTPRLTFQIGGTGNRSETIEVSALSRAVSVEDGPVYSLLIWSGASTGDFAGFQRIARTVDNFVSDHLRTRGE